MASLFKEPFLWHLLQPAQVVCSLELPCHMQWLPPKLCQDMEFLCMDLDPQQYLQDPSLNSLQITNRYFAPKSTLGFAAIAEDGSHWCVK